MHKLYPSTAVCKPQLSLPPLCPFVIPVPLKVFQNLQNFIKILYKTAHSSSYKNLLQQRYISAKGLSEHSSSEVFSENPQKDFSENLKKYFKLSLPPSSVLMSYDFHVSSAGELKLVEVNTHSSGYLASDLADQVQALSFPWKDPLDSLKKSFQNEWGCFSSLSDSPACSWIVDQCIAQQKMYVEFLMYKDFFEKCLGWPCVLQEAEGLSVNAQGELMNLQGQKTVFVYNRSTDFYLEHSKNFPLRQALLKKRCCITPHPLEYFLLADKARLCDWSDEGFFNQIGLSQEEQKELKKVLLKTFLVKNKLEEELWSKRKQYIFKPLRSYGGKSVYRGKSLTRKVFKRILAEDFLCQDLFAPSVFTDSQGGQWKYDLRAFVYKDQLQKLSARVYKGQLTGFSAPLSGFASVAVE